MTSQHEQILLKLKKPFVGGLTTVLLVIAGLVALFPIYIALINAFKTNGEMLRAILALPSEWTLSNFSTAFQRLDFFKSLFNTWTITSLSVIVIIILSSLAGYKIARTTHPAGKFFYMLFVASMLIPFHSIMIPLTRVAMSVGAKGSLLGTVAIYVGVGINMPIFLYAGFVKSIPLDIEEAAIIDGCGPLAVFTHVVLPLLKPITATIAILQALWIWNDFLLPLLMITNSKNYTLILSANSFFGKYETEWPNVLAGLLMTSIPLIAFYIIFQKNIVKGITAGAVKG